MNMNRETKFFGKFGMNYIKRCYNDSIKELKEWKTAQKVAKTKCRFCTDLANNQYMKGWLSVGDMVKKAERSIKGEREKREKTFQGKLSRVFGKESTIKSIDIRVEWKRSQMWGHNPTAEVFVSGDDFCRKGVGTASGCGYDKLSAAVANAFEYLDEFTRELAINYIKWDKKEKKNPESYESKKPYGCYFGGYDNLPHLEGGVGYDCFDRIFLLMGFKRVNYDRTAKSYDHFEYVRDGKKKK